MNALTAPSELLAVVVRGGAWTVIKGWIPTAVVERGLGAVRMPMAQPGAES